MAPASKTFKVHSLQSTLTKLQSALTQQSVFLTVYFNFSSQSNRVYRTVRCENSLTSLLSSDCWFCLISSAPVLKTPSPSLKRSVSFPQPAGATGSVDFPPFPLVLPAEISNCSSTEKLLPSKSFMKSGLSPKLDLYVVVEHRLRSRCIIYDDNLNWFVNPSAGRTSLEVSSLNRRR